jgi:hypothetical protein
MNGVTGALDQGVDNDVSARPVWITAAASRYRKIARDLTKIMVPCQPPNVRLREPAGINHKDLGPWIADHPEKPPKGVWPHQGTQLRGQ